MEFPRRYARLPEVDPAASISPIREWVTLTAEALAAVLIGRKPLALPPLDLTAGTEFRQRVWAALQKIQLGQTKSYGEVAKEIGSPEAVRAVGGACGANPIPLLIPCHRVLAANDELGGFSGGLDWKLRLLAAERRTETPQPSGKAA
ncbi:MAG TPA: methylated-DNA--[protein]-cysteine S-methyltransferase [Verrucomicrobiae bacterium]